MIFDSRIIINIVEQLCRWNFFVWIKSTCDVRVKCKMYTHYAHQKVIFKKWDFSNGSIELRFSFWNRFFHVQNFIRTQFYCMFLVYTIYPYSHIDISHTVYTLKWMAIRTHTIGQWVHLINKTKKNSKPRVCARGEWTVCDGNRKYFGILWRDNKLVLCVS